MSSTGQSGPSNTSTSSIMTGGASTSMSNTVTNPSSSTPATSSSLLSNSQVQTQDTSTATGTQSFSSTQSLNSSSISSAISQTPSTLTTSTLPTSNVPTNTISSSFTASPTSLLSTTSSASNTTFTPTPITITSMPMPTPTMSSGAPAPTSSICTTPPIDTGILDNGDFEMGLNPWSLVLIDLFDTSYALSTPGANSSCTAFSVNMSENGLTQNLRANLVLRSDLVFTRPGAHLTISFFIRFAARNAAIVTLSDNNDVIQTISAFDYGPGGNFSGVEEGSLVVGDEGEAEGDWTQVVLPYVATEKLFELSFTFSLGSALENVIGLDQVAIFPDLGGAGGGGGGVSTTVTGTTAQESPATTLVTALRPRW
ncbi:hypothetical protein F5Y18DRAFT_433190 [Xylariaceae sp. FL1019]|nr:hypothetical protein F5Y18DRAFT_433190 [Xylariaceae sp. FL1019]